MRQCLKISRNEFGKYRGFSYNVRSSVRVNQSEKRHFADLSIACALRNIEEENKFINDLLNLKKQIEDESGKALSVLCVVCGLTNVTYKRPDGVYVVLITSLKP